MGPEETVSNKMPLEDHKFMVDKYGVEALLTIGTREEEIEVQLM